MNVALGHNPSYSWRRIWSTCGQCFCRWRISTDHMIGVWNQPWLREGPNLRLSSTPNLNMMKLTVHNLLLHGARYYNIELLQHIFPPKEVQRIVKVPLLDYVQNDTIIWNILLRWCIYCEVGLHFFFVKR